MKLRQDGHFLTAIIGVEEIVYQQRRPIHTMYYCVSLSNQNVADKAKAGNLNQIHAITSRNMIHDTFEVLLY